jgi:serine/threonine protein kinase/tetratricopeptide (TPR) repeat protein
MSLDDRNPTDPPDPPTDPDEAEERSSVPEGSPTPSGMIGPYRLVSILGEGGMGTVWLAEQTAPVRRKVAVKVIKLGMDTQDVVARFESERQALAVMSHPNIARVYDGGATESGRPYFVMELVQGVPVTEYCDLNRLTTEQRIRLFLDVCGAVQHAHQKGVIHRDLKPSNVLVTVRDQAPVVKIIDFGIAKALGRDLTDRTLVTRFGQLIGTPEYMSPEQADMSALDVDTRTDIYALGIMLYEILVGALPFDLRAKADYAIRNVIHEADVPRPSTRLTTLVDTRNEIARHRRTTPDGLKRALQGDLDWIILKAVEKDRTRRYDSAAGLAMELRRHLNNEPISARPPSTAYRLGKFVRRNRTAVAAAVAVAAALMTGAAAATIGLVGARRSEATARQVSSFMVELFEVSDPGESLGDTITARAVLDRGVERIRTELTDQPIVQGNLMYTMGSVYNSLGIYREAVNLLEEAQQRKRESLGDKHPEVAATLEELGEAYFGLARYDEAEARFEDALEIRLGEATTDASAVASLRYRLGEVYLNEARYPEADSSLRAAQRIRTEAFGPDDARVATVIATRATLAREEGRLDEAAEMYRQALSIRERAYGPEHPQVASALHDLGVAVRMQEDLDEAERLLTRALDLRERVFGPVHPRVATTLNALGNLYLDQERYREAEATFQRSVSVKEEIYGGDHPDLANSINNLAIVYARQEDFDRAEPLMRRAVEMRERILGPDHPSVAGGRFNLGSVLRNTGRLNASESEYRAALSGFEAALGPDHPVIAQILENYAGLLRDMGRSAEADAMEQRATGMRTRLERGSS